MLNCAGPASTRRLKQYLEENQSGKRNILRAATFLTHGPLKAVFEASTSGSKKKAGRTNGTHTLPNYECLSLHTPRLHRTTKERTPQISTTSWCSAAQSIREPQELFHLRIAGRTRNVTEKRTPEADTDTKLADSTPKSEKFLHCGKPPLEHG